MIQKKCGVIFLFSLVMFILPVFSADVQWITSFRLDPAAPEPGTDVNVTASFRVTGAGGIDNLRVVGGIDGYVMFDRTWAHIEDGATRSINFTWSVAVGATITFFGQIDPDNTSTDSDRSNNRLEVTMTPVIRAALGLADSERTPEFPAPGETMHFKYNLYSYRAPSANVRVRATVDEGGIYDQTIPAIPQDGFVPIDIPWIAVEGRHSFRVWVNDGAPGSSINFEISGLPDLKVKSGKVTRDRNNPDKYFYEATFKNVGSKGIYVFNWKADLPEDPTQCKTCPQGRMAAVAPLYALGPGEEKTVRGFMLKSDFTYQSRYPSDVPGCEAVWNVVQFIIDPYGEIEEKEERNNKGEGLFLRWDTCGDNLTPKPKPKPGLKK